HQEGYSRPPAADSRRPTAGQDIPGHLQRIRGGRPTTPPSPNTPDTPGGTGAVTGARRIRRPTESAAARHPHRPAADPATTSSFGGPPATSNLQRISRRPSTRTELPADFAAALHPHRASSGFRGGSPAASSQRA
ncbi:hypothetical protein, partial [Paenarthrobacter sp. Z7-10]|uniref:hypothetical protein n=1 Tax=Paenarthrobacter sp. Z7-10 TaxID=2787635 RepID=UPI003FA78D67